MPVTTPAPVITCDCCGFTITGAYTSVFRNLTNGANTALYFCANKGCDAKLISIISTAQSTEVARHTSAIVGGVIPAHPA